MTPEQLRIVQYGQIMIGMQSLHRISCPTNILNLGQTLVPSGETFDNFFATEIADLAEKLKMKLGKRVGLAQYVASFSQASHGYNKNCMQDAMNNIKRRASDYSTNHKEVRGMLDAIFQEKSGKSDGKLLNDIGLVWTPDHIVDKMLDMVDGRVWSDPTKRVLDPCCGSGGFLMGAVKRFMVGLKDQFPDERERYIHIVENQIYGFDIKSSQLFLSDVLLRGPFNCTPNLCKLDSLTWVPDMKFDVICGNPPYNDDIPYDVNAMGLNKPEQKLAKEAASVIVYEAFAVKCVEQLKASSGQVVLVFSSAWMQLKGREGRAGHSNFRSWVISSNLNKVCLLTNKEWNNNGSNVLTAILAWTGDTKCVLSGHTIDNNVDIDLKKDVVSTPYSGIAKSILNKVQNYPHRIKFSKKCTSTLSVSPSRIVSDRRDRVNEGATSVSLMRPLKITGERFVNLISQQEVDIYTKWWYEPLPSFIIGMFSECRDASDLNLGQLPDILKVLNGQPYDRQLVYNTLGFTVDEVKYLEAKIYDLAKIDGVENVERAKKSNKGDWLVPVYVNEIPVEQPIDEAPAKIIKLKVEIAAKNNDEVARLEAEIAALKK